jgi:VWFA-related protein
MPPLPGRAVAFVVDDLGLSFESLIYVRTALNKFVEEQMDARDVVAIVRTGAGIGALQQFTTDKRLLRSAIDGVKFNFMGRVNVNSFAPLTPDQAMRDFGLTGEEACSLQNSKATGSLIAVRNVVEGLKELPGRKALILFSESMQMLPTSTCDFSRVKENLHRLTDAAERSAVVIYTIDPRGVRSLLFGAADHPGQDVAEEQSKSRQAYFDSQQGLDYLARETGGLFLAHNDTAGAVREAVTDAGSYYLLGYHPPPSTFDPKSGGRTFHRVQVKVKRTGLHVRSRSGFFGVPGPSRVQLPETNNAAITHALLSPFASGDIHLRLTSLFSSAGNPFITTLLYIDGKDVTFANETDGTHKAILDIVEFILGDNGQVVDASQNTYTVADDASTYELAVKNGFVLRLRRAVEHPGPYQIRVVVRDAASQKIGSASQFLEIPDLKRRHLALSGILLKEDKAETSHTGHGQEPAPDARGNEAVRIFRPGEKIRWAVQVLNLRDGQRQDLAVQTRLFHEDKQIYQSDSIPLRWSQESTQVTGHMQLDSGLEPGNYALQVIATDALAKTKHRAVSQWMDFEVQ